MSVNDKEIVLKLEFILSKSQVTGDKAISEGYKKKLLDHTFGVKFDKALMIGFPSGESGPRGPFYWLVLFAES